MSADSLFSLCNLLVLPGWLFLILVPGWAPGRRWICPVLIPALLALTYTVLIVGWFTQAEGGFGSPAQVLELFQNPYVLVAGWVHYLAFDLFIGSWEVRDSRVWKIPHWLVVVCLLLTFLFGPTGLLLYLAVRWLRSGSLELGSASGCLNPSDNLKRQKI